MSERKDVAFDVLCLTNAQAIADSARQRLRARGLDDRGHQITMFSACSAQAARFMDTERPEIKRALDLARELRHHCKLHMIQDVEIYGIKIGR